MLSFAVAPPVALALSRSFRKGNPVRGLIFVGKCRLARGGESLSSAVASPVAKVLSRGFRKEIPVRCLVVSINCRLTRGAEMLSSAVALRVDRGSRDLHEKEDAKDFSCLAALGGQPCRACKAQAPN